MSQSVTTQNLSMSADNITALVRAKLTEATPWSIIDLETLRAHNRPYSQHFTYRVRLVDGSAQLVFVKFVRGITKNRKRLEQLVARDHDITRYLREAFQSMPEFGIPEPIAYSTEHLMLISKFVDGTRLQDKIVRGARFMPSRHTLEELRRDCARCGEWLRAFQHETHQFFASHPPMEGDDFLDLESIKRIVVDRIEELHAEKVLFTSDYHRLVDYVCQIDSKVTPDMLLLSGTHGDFFAGNMLVDDRRATGIDFVMFRKGSIFFDPTYFVFQLETLQARPDYRGAVIQSLGRAFLQGYAPERRIDSIWDLNPFCNLLFVMHTTARLLTLMNIVPANRLRALYARYSINWIRRSLLTRVRN